MASEIKHTTCTSPDTPPLNAHGSDSTPSRSAPVVFPHPNTEKTIICDRLHHMLRASEILEKLPVDTENDRAAWKFYVEHKSVKLYSITAPQETLAEINFFLFHVIKNSVLPAPLSAGLHWARAEK